MPAMTPEMFVAALKTEVFDATVESTVRQLTDGPPGRASQPRATAISAWYRSLGDQDREMLREVIRDAAHSAIFGVLCVLDGVRVVDNPPHVELTLEATRDGHAVTLASADSAAELHDEFNAVVHPPSEPWPL